MRQPKRFWLVSLGVIFFAIGASDLAEAQKEKGKPKKKPPVAAAKKPPKSPGGDSTDAPASSASPPASSAGATGASEDARVLQRGERIEFDARLIQGQTAKAGAVYLFERASSNLRSMVKDRSSFRDRIVRTVFPATSESKSDGKEESSP